MRPPLRSETDVFTKDKRSEVMSRIRGRGTRGTELALRELLQRSEITGWRRHPVLFGRPDFLFRYARVAIFVDGCFWHGCPNHSAQPKNNAEFWAKKLAANRARDRVVSRKLRERGWHVLRIWEHELRPKAQRRTLSRIRRALSEYGPAAHGVGRSVN